MSLFNVQISHLAQTGYINMMETSSKQNHVINSKYGGERKLAEKIRVMIFLRQHQQPSLNHIFTALFEMKSFSL